MRDATHGVYSGERAPQQCVVVTVTIGIVMIMVSGAVTGRVVVGCTWLPHPSAPIAGDRGGGY
jgi:hypothetical protein